ncbi:hypothetical protein HGRIS_005863 [Hohenbuehelia grisea]|uniref:Dienelactone hydrolase domain-containing protein n=1 Tax=Hohenbuehelia grisea TaxID=104357 RepID=A0ABR3JZ72_9AGAR
MSCPDCKRGTILEGDPKGVISDINGAYFTPAPGEATTKRAIIFLTDAFGLPLVNSKLLADMFAERLACDVWVPDLFDGVPIVGVNQLELPVRAGLKRSLWARISMILRLLPSIPAFYRSRPSVAFARLEAFIHKLQTEKHYDQLGAVGYCFGGSMAAMLAATDHIKSAVVAHPGSLTPQQINAIKVRCKDPIYLPVINSFSIGPSVLGMR